MIGNEPIHQHEEITISKSVRVTGTGAIVAPLLQLTGAVRILEQYAVITSVTTLVNATAIYADLWDGTVATDLTADGIVLSGAGVGTLFMKDKASTEPYSLLLSDQARMNEVALARNVGKAFTVNQKIGVDTFLRLHLTTTDSPVDFIVNVVFVYIPLMYDGSKLEFL